MANAEIASPKITFIGAGSTVFMKKLIGDILLKPALNAATITLMDINNDRLAESEMVARKLVSSHAVPAVIDSTTDQRKALQGADFVIVAFQVGGYDPCTIIDFEVPKKYGLRQTIADTLGIGGIMRGLRTVPHLWKICEDMLSVCPNALLLQYANPMAINTWAIANKYPDIRQIGLCHSVQNTVFELARDLEIPQDEIRYHAAGINHMAFFLKFEQRLTDGSYRDLYPLLRQGYTSANIPKPSHWNERCPNIIRYEMMMRTGYFVTESSEHFAEYVPYFIKRDRQDLIDRFRVPLDEYPKRCVEQIDAWKEQIDELQNAQSIEVDQSNEYAAILMNSIVTGQPAVIYGNVQNNGAISSLPQKCAVEVPCLVDGNGIQPTKVNQIPPQLLALMRTNINVQELTVAALMEENREHIFHAAMLDPHTAAELDLEQIWNMTEELITAHGTWLPGWIDQRKSEKVT
ncbi:MAG: alpha-glucosidase/alpha-galactosidase [Hyphomicrobiales bacterium]|nr:alpha-glucosidase/alpha-galactosidase [Hyphomicrobiales bacterium]